MQNLVIFGAGGLAKEVSALVSDINKEKKSFQHIAYVVDDDWYKDNTELHGIPVMNRKWLINHRDEVICSCAIGYSKERRNVQEKLIAEGVRFVNLIHPSARIGEGSIIGTGCILQHHSSVSLDCRLGNGVFLSDYVTIGHDAVLGDYVTCFPKTQVSGNVKIGEAASLGSLSFVNEKRSIGKESVVAPGSIVFRNVKNGSHVMGNPAKRIEI